MGLLDNPPTRPRTYVEGVPIDPNDLNETFDKAIDLDLKKAPQPDSKTIVAQPQKATNWSFVGDIAANPAGLEAGWVSSGIGDLDICLSDYMYEGQTLDSVRLWVSGDGLADITATVYYHDFFAGTVTQVATNTINNPGAAPATSFDLSALDVVAGQLTGRIWLRVSANAANARLHMLILGFPPLF